MFRSFGSLQPRGVAVFLLLLCGCGEPADQRISVVRVAPEAAPDCGAPADARTMILRALGDFPASEATAQSLALGSEGEFAIDRFPPSTTTLEAEIRGFGGALRVVGKTPVFALDDLASDGEITLFMAPLEGVCATGPTQVARIRPKLARTGNRVLLVGGTDLNGEPSLAIELYRPAEGRFDQLEGTTYGDTSALGLAGASVTTLPNGDVAIVGGAATAFQIFDEELEEFSAPSFYREARGHHASLALPDLSLFLAAGCSQVSARGCVPGSELRTSAVLDLATGEIVLGPGLQIDRIGGAAWLEEPGQVLLVGGTRADGAPQDIAERVFLDGRPSQVVPGIGGASAQAASGTLWAGLATGEGPPSDALVALVPGESRPVSNMQTSFPDSDAALVALDDGSLLAVGALAAQRIRTLEGRTLALNVGELENRTGQSAIKLPDGSVLITGGRLEDGATAPTLVFRPRLVGPESASAAASFSSTELSEGLSARDPGRVTLASDGGAHLRLAASSLQYVLLAGPHPQNARLQAAASITPGDSVIFYFGWQSESLHYEVVAQSGQVPELFVVKDGSSQAVEAGDCEASQIPAAAIEGLDDTHEMELLLQSSTVVLSMAGQTRLSCTLDEAPAGGMMGIGALGAAGAELRLDLISLSR